MKTSVDDFANNSTNPPSDVATCVIMNEQYVYCADVLIKQFRIVSVLNTNTVRNTRGHANLAKKERDPENP